MKCYICGEDRDSTKQITTPKGLLGIINVCKDCEPVMINMIREQIKNVHNGGN